MSNARTSRLVIGSVVCAVGPLVVACGGSSSTTPSPSASSPVGPSAASKPPSKLISGKIDLEFSDSAAQVGCPPTAPSKAECFRLTGAATVRAFGVVKIGPTLDPEVSTSSPLCGKAARYTTTVTGAHGTMTVSESGPRLCLGRTTPEPRHFTVVRGTGAYTGATGAGTISLVPQSVGAIEVWTGMITLAGR